ncbi:ABC-2 transporter permease [Oceanobacillus jeddahense]|uniref:ABC-2 transporter permease n=1 Tax=Oceanobacillus jeddahense TaxID=1462527 RepID=A0ABY5JZH4_9BACI|nr:ABC-2 transporter permease [Oceanobacillus jeddahense]UUI03924.1 ABC-2 transporter permease [Oceanobacillus jeddahense]
MFNLIKKDVFIQKTQIGFLIPIIMIFAIFIKDIHPAFIFLMASVFIPLNAYIFDQQSKSNILLNSLPYTRKEIVAARYIGAIVYMILSIALAGGILYIFQFDYMIRDMAIAAGLFCLIASFAFPLFYFLKAEYIFIAAFIGFIASTIILPPVFRFLAEHLTTITDFITSLSTSTLYLSGAAIAIGLYLISWVVSQFIYQRKVF